jgi:hypothetical protein
LPQYPFSGSRWAEALLEIDFSTVLTQILIASANTYPSRIVPGARPQTCAASWSVVRGWREGMLRKTGRFRQASGDPETHTDIAPQMRAPPAPPEPSQRVRFMDFFVTRHPTAGSHDFAPAPPGLPPLEKKYPGPPLHPDLPPIAPHPESGWHLRAERRPKVPGTFPLIAARKCLAPSRASARNDTEKCRGAGGGLLLVGLGVGEVELVAGEAGPPG